MNFRQISLLFALCVFSTFLVSCGEYQKALKSQDVALKTQMADSLYNNKQYYKAQRLYEQVLPRVIGKPQGERQLYYYASALYLNEDYYLSGYQFDRFLKTYPQSDKAEEAAFYGAHSYYEQSPRYSLDQTETDRAISKIQAFINAYPNSEFFERANEMAMELTRKKEKKAFEIAKQYDKLGEFNFPVLISAITSVDNFVTENPGSVFKEDALFYKVRSSVNLAINSTTDKKEERIQEARRAHEDLLRNFPDTKYKQQLDELMVMLNAESQNTKQAESR